MLIIVILFIYIFLFFRYAQRRHLLERFLDADILGCRLSYDNAQLELKKAVIKAKQHHGEAVLAHNQAVINARDSQIAKKRTAKVDKKLKQFKTRTIAGYDIPKSSSAADIESPKSRIPQNSSPETEVHDSSQSTLLTQFLSYDSHPLLRQTCIRLVNCISAYAIGRVYLRLHCVPPRLNYLNQTSIPQLIRIRFEGSILAVIATVLLNESPSSPISQHVSSCLI